MTTLFTLRVYKTIRKHLYIPLLYLLIGVSQFFKVAQIVLSDKLFKTHWRVKMVNEVHKENGVTCVFDKKHYNNEVSTDVLHKQKNYRASVGVWTTVQAMAKMQSVEEFKDVTNATEIIVKMINNKYNIGLTLEDFNRSLSVLEPKQAKADTTSPMAVWINEQLSKHGKSESEIIDILKAQKWTDEQLKPYFKSMQSVPNGVPQPPQ